MTNTITINNQDLALRQYNGQMVITFKDIDRIHSRPDGTARKRFYDNKRHFIEGEDFFNVQMSEKRTLGFDIPNRGLILITESGYLMLVKSFTDDLSWEVQRQLVKTYFRYKEQAKLPNPNDKPYEYFDKTYNGVPVLTTEDICQMTGIHTATIAWYIKNKTEADKDHYRLTGIELRKFKAENPKLKKILKCIYAITQSGFIKFCKAYGIKMEEPRCFEQKEQPKISAVHRIYDAFRKYYDIKHCRLTEDVAKALDCGKSSLINESCVLHRQDNDQYKIFTDQTAPLIERQFMMAENLGRIMAGQLRENANPDINYDQEARLFGVVVMAMSLFFDN